MTPPRRGVTDQAANAAVDQACRALRLPTIRTRYGEVADAAEREQLTYRGFLAELLMTECDDRGRRRSERQIKAAGFPRQKWLTDFDYSSNPTVNPATINTLASCAWVRAGEPLCLIGDSGTGKSHLLIALGAAAAIAGYRVRYILAAKLVNELVEAADEKMLNKTIARYGRVDLLVARRSKCRRASHSRCRRGFRPIGHLRAGSSARCRPSSAGCRPCWTWSKGWRPRPRSVKAQGAPAAVSGQS